MLLDALVDRLGDDGFGGILLVLPLQPGGQVDRVADGGEVHALTGAHGAEDHVAGVDANADGHDRQAFLLAFFLLGHHGVANLHGRPAGVDLLVRAVEEGHHLVAHEFVHVAVVLQDDLGLKVEVAVEDAHDLIRLHAFAQSGEAADIGEEEGELTVRAGSSTLLGLLEGGG